MCIRDRYSSEPARLEVMLLGMQGLGKPGVHQAKMIEWSLWNRDYPVPYQGQFTPQMPHICDALRPVEYEDIRGANRLRYAAAVFALILALIWQALAGMWI